MTWLPGALPNILDSMFPSPKDHWIIGRVWPGHFWIYGQEKVMQPDRLMACISQSAGLVSINDLDPLFTILEVKGPNGAEQSCLCVCESVCVCVWETETQRERKPLWLCVTAWWGLGLWFLGEVVQSKLYSALLSCEQAGVCVCVRMCVFSIKSIWRIFMSAFVCVPNIHSVGSSLMGCVRYFTWIPFHACERWAF